MLNRSRHAVIFADSFQNENVGIMRNNKTTSSSSSMIDSTPSTKKRVAFGDASNRKQQSMQQIPVSKSLGTPSGRRAALGDISNKKSTKQQQSKISKQRNGFLSTKKKKKLQPITTKQIHTNKFNVLPTRINNTTLKNTPSLKSSIKTTMKTPKLRPVENIEFRATRPFNPFDEYDGDVDTDVLDLSIYDSDEDDDRIFPSKDSKSNKKSLNNNLDDFAWMMEATTLMVDDYLVDNASLTEAIRKDDEIDLLPREKIDILGCRLDISF